MTVEVKFQLDRKAWAEVKTVPRVVGVTGGAVSSLATIASKLSSTDENIAEVTATVPLMPGRQTKVYVTSSTVQLRCVARELASIDGADANDKKKNENNAFF